MTPEWDESKGACARILSFFPVRLPVPDGRAGEPRGACKPSHRAAGVASTRRPSHPPQGQGHAQGQAQGRKNKPFWHRLLSIIALFLLATPRAPATDCNGNGTDDLRDIETATSNDCNENGVPDECDIVLPAFDLQPASLPVASFPRAVQSGDLDGDGHPDLVSGNQNADTDRTSTLSLLLGRGGGTFAPSVELGAGARLCHLTVGDLDGDGALDLASANVDQLLVFLSDGGGKFREPVPYPVGDGARFVAAGDVDNDGDADLVTADAASRSVAVLPNEGDGGFSPPETFATEDTPTAVALADLDDDGDLDLAVTAQDSTTLSVLRNDGGTGPPFDLAREEHDIGAGEAHSVIAGDFTGDGALDLIVGTRTVVSLLENDASSLEGDAGGAFGPPLPLAETGSSNSLAAGDFDGDGDDDVAVGFLAPRKVSLILGDGMGSFLALDALNLVRILRSNSLLADDLDGDGNDDLGLLTFNASAVTLYRNVENRTNHLAFEEARTFPAGGRPHTTDLGDLDGDGDLDLVIARNHDGGVSVLLGQGDGNLSAPVMGADGVGTFAVAMGDLDADGDLDLASVNQDIGRLNVLPNGGDANFRRGREYIVGQNPFHVTAAEINGDERLDLLVSNRSSNSVSLLLGAENAPFESTEPIRVGNGPIASVASDLDGDGDNDFAVAHRVSSDVSILTNLGGGSFSAPTSYAVTGTPSFITAGDLSGDGHVDLITANENGTVSILFSRGDGTFDANIRSLPTGHAPYSVFLADLDHDGKADIVTASELDGSLSFLLSTDNFRQPLVQQVGRGARFAAAGDLDQDGDLDLVSGNRGDNNVTVLLRAATGGVAESLERICTELDFHTFSVPSESGSRDENAGERTTHYIVPARDDPALLPPLFHNVRRYPLHQDFLREVFPERFGELTSEAFRRLVGRRESREYYVGTVRRVRKESAVIYTFTVVADTGFHPSEVLGLDEIRRVYDTLGGAFELGPLHYHPEGELARREVEENWPSPPPLPVYFATDRPNFDYEAYSLAVGYGRVRVMREEDDESGCFTFTDILVVDQPPRDIDGVVGGLITGEPQGSLSRTATRLARQRVPTAYVAAALEVLGQHDGTLVRLEVCESGYTVDADVTLAEAEAFWASRPQAPTPPPVDADYMELDSLAEIDLSAPGGVPEALFGGKAVNLARLGRMLTGNLEMYREPGFAIPMRYSLEFLRSNTVTIGDRELTYEERLAELLAEPEFPTDPCRRSAALGELGELIRNEGVVDPELVQRLTERITEVFGSTSLMLRFRSSANIEDTIEWSEAGLDAAAFACAADTLELADLETSLCDPGVAGKRPIERALKEVWASLWTFRAFEARAHLQLPHHRVAMGILVSRAFDQDVVGGVAFTRDPRDPADRRYVVTAQVGAESAVHPAPGVTTEVNRLEQIDGEVRILREQSSSLVAPGETVLSDAQLRELAGLMAFVEENAPFELGEVARDDVLFELEYRIEPEGSLALTQVRPFLLPATSPRPPTFELEIPPGTEICGVFTGQRFGRDLRTEYETKSTVRLVEGTHELPATSAEFAVELIEEVRYGPDAELATRNGPGLFRVIRIPTACNRAIYRFNYEQQFTLAGGEPFIVRIFNLQLEAQGERALERRVIDEEFATFELLMEGELAGEPVVSYSSCSHDLLPLWSLEIALEEGSSIHLEERFLPSENDIATGPASLIRADLRLGGAQQTVSDYLQLVYAARRHNRNVQYWVVLDPPLDLPTVADPVHIVEIAAPEPIDESPARVRYLGEDFAVLSEPGVLHFERTAGRLEASFVRGDVDGMGTVNVADALALLRFLFQREATPGCLKAADANDDGRVNVKDAIDIVHLLFRKGGSLPEPSACGTDPTDDRLSCERSTCR